MKKIGIGLAFILFNLALSATKAAAENDYELSTLFDSPIFNSPTIFFLGVFCLTVGGLGLTFFPIVTDKEKTKSIYRYSRSFLLVLLIVGLNIALINILPVCMQSRSVSSDSSLSVCLILLPLLFLLLGGL